MRARDNPFASHRLERLAYRFLTGSWLELRDRLASLGGRGAIVGPDGSGKTTLLEQLARRLAADGIPVALVGAEPERGPRRDVLGAALRSAGPETHLLVDGADALAPGEWRRLERDSRRLAALVVTSHRDGLLPALHRTTTSAGLLAELVAELTEESVAARIDAAAIYRQHDGDLRAALRALYDRCAVGAIEVGDGPC
ncbi:MAG: hypothetical protein IPJ17_18845 [Holophagales bacterium]|nr:MAG: hypothetical protein IPJ17_18845 [Holophagales bacterium]